jgi:hypothetical protein
MVACSSIGAAGVAMIFVIYSAYMDYERFRKRRRCVLHERVAHLLWAAAGETRTVGGPARN